MSRSITVSSILLAATLMSGCGSNNSTPTSPTQPTSVTDVATATLTVNGANTFPFAVQQTGSVSVTLTTVSDTAATIGLSLGAYNSSGACQILIANDNAIQGTTVLGTATSTGNFCARVYDVGKLTAAVDYQISVTHF